MRFAAVLLLLLAAIPASAKEITITLSDDEQKALLQIIDEAVKATGMRGAVAGVYFTQKVENAQKAASAPAAAEQAKPAAK